MGNGPALVENDLVGPASAAENLFRATCLTPGTAPTIRRLAELAPRTLALMHGSSFTGHAQGQLRTLADNYDRRLAQARPGASGANGAGRVAPATPGPVALGLGG